MISADEALRQASMTAHDYALCAHINLCKILDLEQRDPKLREKLAPFAVVWAAMIAAAAKDFDTAMREGVVAGLGQPPLSPMWHRTKQMEAEHEHEQSRARGAATHAAW
jgi:hypothetical protein